MEKENAKKTMNLVLYAEDCNAIEMLKVHVGTTSSAAAIRYAIRKTYRDVCEDIGVENMASLYDTEK